MYAARRRCASTCVAVAAKTFATPHAAGVHQERPPNLLENYEQPKTAERGSRFEKHRPHWWPQLRSLPQSLVRTSSSLCCDVNLLFAVHLGSPLTPQLLVLCSTACYCRVLLPHTTRINLTHDAYGNACKCVELNIALFFPIRQRMGKKKKCCCDVKGNRAGLTDSYYCTEQLIMHQK